MKGQMKKDLNPWVIAVSKVIVSYGTAAKSRGKRTENGDRSIDHRKPSFIFVINLETKC